MFVDSMSAALRCGAWWCGGDLQNDSRQPNHTGVTSVSATSPLSAEVSAASECTGLRCQLADAHARIASLQAAAAEVSDLKQRLELSTASHMQQEVEVHQLQSELSAARERIVHLEAELQDTMDAAMQLWETVQVRAQGCVHNGSLLSTCTRTLS